MARYIDADELRSRVKTETNPYGKPTLDYESGVKVLNMIDQQHTADVVQMEYCDACAEKTRKFIASLQKQIADTKAEVAREIFEEIYKLVASKIQPHIRPIFKDDMDFDGGFRNGKTDALIEVLMLIAELKKKYTEDQT